VANLPAACRQAQFVALLNQHGIVPTRIAQFDRLADVGVYRLLYGLWGTPALGGFIDDALGDLRKRDKRGTLRETFLAYLNSGGSHVETAAALGIHRNTLAYRLRQIGSLIGRDPDDPEMRLVMHLALVAARLPTPDGRLPA
jgi:DNA-binding PucR family transcriptional regulator